VLDASTIEHARRLEAETPPSQRVYEKPDFPYNSA
jgi:hypothetical protein